MVYNGLPETTETAAVPPGRYAAHADPIMHRACRDNTPEPAHAEEGPDLVVYPAVRSLLLAHVAVTLVINSKLSATRPSSLI
jgi:hypothetical protein